MFAEVPDLLKVKSQSILNTTRTFTNLKTIGEP